ncbi:MAG TPA: hypothetical protein VIG06_28285 [Kofleriaceae bacterium]
MSSVDDKAIAHPEKSIRDALRDATASVCSIMIRGANDVVHEVVAVPVRTSPLSYLVEGPGFRHHGLSEQDAVKTILQLGVPLSIAVARSRL